MKSIQKILGLGVLCCFVATFAHADLLGFAPSFPQISYDSTDPNSISYDPGTQVFTVDSLPVAISFSAVESSDLIVSNRSIQIQLNTDGSLLSGANGFTITGFFTRVVGGVTNTYSGVLLQGDVIGFGYNDSEFTDNFDFRIHVTGGALQSFFSTGDNGDIIAQVASESSTFNGDFTEEFHGTVKGVCGPIDTTPPDVTCPPLSLVVTTPATNSDNVPGFIITYPDPIVTDNTDPAPFVFADTPSGTFVALNPGDTLTITVFAFDAAGNLNFCSFDVTMGQNGGGGNGSCSLAFTDSGCGLTTLTNDPGKCSAAYTFTAPAATNCSGSFAASPTAVDQSGMVIALTSLGGGAYSGVFPRSTTGTNVITFTASDGNGNSVTRQCFVAVVDGEAPTINCMNQTGTFKPILTNALSCIEADFDDDSITASNFIWFTSSIQTPSSRNSSFTVHIFDQTIQLSVDNSNIVLDVPEAYVIFSNGVPTATTVFSNGVWITITKPGVSGNTFASALQWQVPFDLNGRYGSCWGRDRDDGHTRFKRHVNSATWCARFAVDKPGVVINWQWSAVVHSSMTNDCNKLGVKPCDDNSCSNWRNNDPAGCCENFKSFLVCGARGRGWYSVVWPRPSAGLQRHVQRYQTRQPRIWHRLRRRGQLQDAHGRGQLRQLGHRDLRPALRQHLRAGRPHHCHHRGGFQRQLEHVFIHAHGPVAVARRIRFSM